MGRRSSLKEDTSTASMHDSLDIKDIIKVIDDKQEDEVLVYKRRHKRSKSKSKSKKRSKSSDGRKSNKKEPVTLHPKHVVFQNESRGQQQKKRSSKNRRSKSQEPKWRYTEMEASGPGKYDSESPTLNSSSTSSNMWDLEQPSTSGPHRTEGVSYTPKQVAVPYAQDSSTRPDHRVSFQAILTHRLQSLWKEVMRYKVLKLSQLLLAAYIAVLTFADIGPPGGLRDTNTGLIVDKASPERTNQGLILVNGTVRAIVASSTIQVACIGIARLSAWFMYPALVLVFISKFRATTLFLTKSPLAMYMYHDSHDLHVYCGWTIFVSSILHTVAHLTRWALQGNLNLLFRHFSGITGLLIISSCMLICIPMTLFRNQIKYEIRKKLHYLFILFAGALIFHTPTSAIPNGGFTAYVFASLLVWYFLDATYCFFLLTEKIETTSFAVVPSGVRMTMNVSEGFQKVGAQGGICYVCLPWVAKSQWHAFSLFENPANPAERQIFIQKTGDWTSKLHGILQRETARPAWVHGPFPSPYDHAEEYDKLILVASGIGITPALSVIRAHKQSRRINLIWMVRDEHLMHRKGPRTRGEEVKYRQGSESTSGELF